MATLPSKESMQGMLYRDLQKLCKDWGVRANLKSEEMINLLLEAQSEQAPLPAPAPAPTSTPTQVPAPPQTQQRSVSTRHSSRTGPSRVSSLIIHDVQEEPPNDAGVESNTDDNAKAVSSIVPAPRTRKAKELQRKLGVGRPVAIGGTGPRAVTRSTTMSRERRLRSSRSTRQTEATILEEPDIFDESQSQQINPPTELQPATSKSEGELAGPIENRKEIDTLPTTTISDYQALLSEIIKPLQEQIETLRAEAKRVQTLEAELEQLRSQVGQLDILGAKVGHLTAEVQNLRTRLDTEDQTPRNFPVDPSTPPASGVPQRNQILYDPLISTESPRTAPHPGVAPVLLGKRHRQSSINATPIAEGDHEQEYTPTVSGPSKKRIKLSNETPSFKGKEIAQEESTNNEESTADTVATTALPRAASFIVYNDPDEDVQLLDSPPPTALLPEFYVPRSGGSTAGSSSPKQVRSTSTANASENQQPLNFSLLPGASTPGPSLFMPAFPYPEPPQSPTPIGTGLTGPFGNGANERTDIFKSFGLPPPDRARRLPASGAPSDTTINPVALSQRNPSGRQREPTSSEIGVGLGLVPTSSEEPGSNSDRDTPVVRKTMYGTELEGDTRFGDFGVEGVATGFWAGGRF